eukprot:458704-Prorocentrum_minimum.AAC.6
MERWKDGNVSERGCYAVLYTCVAYPGGVDSGGGQLYGGAGTRRLCPLGQRGACHGGTRYAASPHV